jgi:hypothetical protein
MLSRFLSSEWIKITIRNVLFISANATLKNALQHLAFFRANALQAWPGFVPQLSWAQELLRILGGRLRCR